MSSAGDVLRLREGLADKFGERELRPQRFRATMGDGTGAVKVPGKPNYVYVRRLGRGLIEECLNNKAAARDGLPIIAGHSHESPDTLQVLEVDWLSFSAPGAYPYTQHHHEAHELHNVHGGDDVVWVQSQQIMPLLVYPTNPASMRVNVFGGWYPWASGWHYFDSTLSADLTAHVPALPAEARYVLISIDGATEALQYTAGATFPIFLPPVDAENMLPAPPIGSIPTGAVYLPFGTTALDWDNLHDIRLFNQPMGGSITPGVHALLDTTVHSDTATDAPTRGSLIYSNATPLWDELNHPAAAGYALTTDANDIMWNQTPAWTGEHSFAAGIAFIGASGANEITVPDNTAIALELLDAGGLEYMRAISTDVQPVTVFNFGEVDVDFRVAALGITDALFVQGISGFVGMGRSTPEGHLDIYDIAVDTTISYYGIYNEHVKTLGATDCLDNLEGIHNHIEFDQNGATIGYLNGINNRTILTSGSVGNGGVRDMRGIYNYLWMEDATCTVTDDVQGILTNIDLNGGTVGDDIAGHHIYVNLRAAMTSIGGNVYGIYLYLHAGQDPVGTAYSVYWEEGTNVDYGIYQNGTAPNRFGGHVDPASASGQDLGDATHRWDLYTQDVIFGGATGANVVTVPDNIADALGLLDAGGLEHVRVVSTDANPYFLIDPAAAGIKVGIGTASPGALLDAVCTTAVTNTYQDVVHIEAVSTGNMVDDFGPRMNFAIKDGAVATQHIASIIACRDGADNTGGLLFAVKNAGAWDYTAMYINPGGAVAVKALVTPAGAGLTIDAAGAITVTHSYHPVDTFGGAATDNLITINGGMDGQILILRSANSARDTTLTQAGNIWLDAAGNFTLTSVADRVTLQKQGASWLEISRSNNN